MSATNDNRRGESLAYEHNVSIELSKELLLKRMQDVRTACASEKSFNCTLLNFSISTDNSLPSGMISLRVAPAAVRPLIDLASKDGEIISNSTHAEDLAQPVADTERELAQRITHRDRMAEFMKDKSLKVDQLITVSKELSEVQTQIDGLSTRKADLERRINTELLTINMGLPRAVIAAENNRISDSIKTFGANFRGAIANVIEFTAGLLPWLVIILPGIVLLRLFWSWISRWLSRRAAS
jgi:hypothetical protein